MNEDINIEDIDNKTDYSSYEFIERSVLETIAVINSLVEAATTCIEVYYQSSGDEYSHYIDKDNILNSTVFKKGADKKIIKNFMYNLVYNGYFKVDDYELFCTFIKKGPAPLSLHRSIDIGSTLEILDVITEWLTYIWLQKIFIPNINNEVDKKVAEGGNTLGNYLGLVLYQKRIGRS